MLRTRTRVDDADPKIVALRTAFGAAGTRPHELVALAALFDELRLDPGEPLTRQGEPGHELFLIVDGQAEVSVDSRPLCLVGPGEFVGEMSLFERAPRSATVTAVTPVRTLVAGPQSFATLLTDASVVRRLAATVARRLRICQGSPPPY